MKKYIKTVSLALAATMLAALVCACAPGNTASVAPSEPEESSAPVSSEPEEESSEPEPKVDPCTVDAPDVIRVMEPRGREETPDLLSYASTDGEGLTVEGEYDLDVPGEYLISFAAFNSAGDKTVKETTLKVLALAYGEDGKLVDGEYETIKGFPLVVRDGIAYVDGYLIANKTYPLPSDYLPGGLLPEVEQALAEMRAEAPADIRGRVYCLSGYRSYADQRYIYNSYLSYDPKEKVDTYSARPGHSEHQSGYALDILMASSALAGQPGYKEVFDWLGENAWKYGFILRYPYGKTDQTGYIYEPWHFRYVGKELSEILYADGEWITMEDYFGFDSEYKS